MATGKQKRHAKQASMWVAAQDLPRSAAHPFYVRLNQILDQYDFDGYVEALCQQFYADDGRRGLTPGRYFRLLLVGYFEGLDAERTIAWRAADSFALREFLGLVLPEAPRGLQGRLVVVFGALLTLLRQPVTHHKLPVRLRSTPRRVSIARLDIADISAREVAFTTGL